MPIQDFTYLAAVNLALSAVGQSPVATLGSGAGALAVMAENILNETSLDVQAMGWWFNTEKEVTYTPTTENEIILGDAVLHADSSDNLTNCVKRGNRLYDLDDHTFTFTAAIDLDVIMWLEWLEMPIQARQYIAKKAARILAERYTNDSTLNRNLAIEEQRAFERMNVENSRQGDSNFLSGNPERWAQLNYGGRGAIERGLI